MKTNTIYQLLIIFLIIVVGIYLIWIMLNKKIDLEEFSNQPIEKYNLIKLSTDLTINDNNDIVITLDDTYFLKELTLTFDNLKIVSYGFKIIVEDTINNKEYELNMDNYESNSKNEYSLDTSKQLKYDNLKDKYDNKLFGNRIIIKNADLFNFTDTNSTQSLDLKKIRIYGNKSGSDYSENITFTEKEMTSNIGEQFISHIKIDTSAMSDNDTVNKINIKYKNKYLDFQKNLGEFMITQNDNIIYLEKVILADNLVITNITNSPSTTLNNSEYTIFSKNVNFSDLENYKLENNIIDFQDKINPDLVCNIDKLKSVNNVGMELLDILNYQEKINSEMKELDMNKINIRRQENQKIEIQNLVNKINRITDKYLQQVKNDDDYNNKKFFETIEVLNFLKKELDNRSTEPKLNINVKVD